jgi:GT2 family glycosyltransferase
MPGNARPDGRRVAAVLLCWNDGATVRDLLLRLREIEPSPMLAIVVDNGSEDGAAASLSAAFPEHRVIPLGRNHGFAYAANRGIEAALAAGAEWIWLLNTDIELPADVLAKLLDAAMKQDACGFAAPVLVERDGSVQARGGGRVNLWTGIARHVQQESEGIGYVTGACLLLRATMLGAVGLFDERYFFYWEDVDLSLRARKAGWSFAVAHDCRVLHLDGGSLGRWSSHRWFLMFRGLRTFLAAHAPMPTLAIAIRLLHHSVAMARHGRYEAIRGAWRGALGARPR